MRRAARTLSWFRLLRRAPTPSHGSGGGSRGLRCWGEFQELRRGGEWQGLMLRRGGK